MEFLQIYTTTVSMYVTCSLSQKLSAYIGHSDLCVKESHRSETKTVCPKKKRNTKKSVLRITPSTYFSLANIGNTVAPRRPEQHLADYTLAKHVLMSTLEQ